MSSSLFLNEKIIIESLELVNFMCHKHLLVSFKSPFTCINGRNGSGKSAIMISFGILFGQRANALERGNNVKSLIKSNENYCVIRCSILNHKRFMYDFFNDYILIEKRLTLKSTSLSIMNKHHRVWSNRKDDLEFLLEFYGIQIDNPLNFLTQEQSKRFLNSSSPSQMYKFFLKATEISDIKEINETFSKNVNEMTSIIDDAKKDVEEIEIKLGEENKKMVFINNIKNLKEELKKLDAEEMWCGVEDLKIKAEGIYKKVEEIKTMYKTLQDSSYNIKSQFATLNSRKNEIIRNSNELRKKNELRKTEISNTIDLINKKVREIDNDLAELVKQKDIKDDLIKKYETIHQLNDRKPKIISEKEELEREILIFEKKIKSIEELIDEQKVKRDEEIAEMESYNKKLYALKKQIEYLNRECHIEDTIDPSIKSILRDIKNMNFKDRVIGPIGHYVKLKEQKWGKAVSIVLKNIVSSFICFNSEDRDLLFSVFKKYRVNFQILVPSKKSGNLIDFKRNYDFKTIFDILDVKSTAVLNQLIIICSIEQIILVEHREKGYKIMRSNPRNVDCAYTINGDKIKNINGSLSDYVSNKVERGFFESPKDKLEQKKNELKKIEENQPTSHSTKKYNELKSEFDSLSFKLSTHQRKIKELASEYESVLKTETSSVTNENIDQELKLLNQQINGLTRQKNKYFSEIKGHKDEFENIVNTKYESSQSIDTEIQKIESVLRESSNKMMDLINKSSFYDNEYKQKLSEYNFEKQKVMDIIPEEIIPRSRDVINNRRAQVKAEIEISEKFKVEDCVEEKIAILEKQKDEKFKVIKENKEMVNNLHRSYLERIKKRDEIKYRVSEQSGKLFKSITEERGYRGELIFDHEKETLDVKVGVHGQELAGAKETLSGGEKSFAGTALLFSLWPFISCPIKILDEFDVFMDEVNRKFIIKKFIDFFEESKSQVILITPLDTKDFQNRNVNVIVLSEPIKK